MVAPAAPVASTGNFPRKRRKDAGPTNGARLPVPILTKLKARNMFLTQCATHEEIAQATGLTVKASQNLCSREGWTKQRRELLRKAESELDARAGAKVDEVSEAIASESEEIAMLGLVNARKSAASNSEVSAKKFQAWTGGARNLVNIARACRGLDRGAGAGESGPSVTNIFAVGSLTFAQAGAGKPDPVNVTPAAPQLTPAAPAS